MTNSKKRIKNSKKSAIETINNFTALTINWSGTRMRDKDCTTF
jgi:hypothetical protein